MASTESKAYVKSELAILALMAISRTRTVGMKMIMGESTLCVDEGVPGDRGIGTRIYHTLCKPYKDTWCFIYKNVNPRAANSLVRKGDVVRAFHHGPNIYQISEQGHERLLRALPKI